MAPPIVLFSPKLEAYSSAQGLKLNFEQFTYLYDKRTEAGVTFDDWHQQIDKMMQLYRGEGLAKMPSGENLATEPFLVQNLIHDGMKDLARLISEARPSIRCYAVGGNAKAGDSAQLVKAISNGYWMADRSEWDIATLGEYFAGSGAMFLLSTVDQNRSPYPFHRLLHPRNCFPFHHGKQLLDLLHVTKMPAAVAARVFQDEFSIPVDADKPNEMVEVCEGWGPDRNARILYKVNGEKMVGPIYAAHYEQNRIGRCQVAWSKESSFDDHLGGLFDQGESMMAALNTLHSIIIIHAAKSTFGELVHRGMTSRTRGPGGEIELDSDPMLAASAGYLTPPQLSNAVFGAAAGLEEQLRGSLSYNRARAGNVRQSIISGPGVQGLQGERDSLVWSVERRLAELRTLQTETDIELDKSYLNNEKDLLWPAGKKMTYKPSEDLPDRYWIEFVYPGAGVSPYNRAVTNIQKVAVGLMSEEQFFEQDPDTVDPMAVMNQVVYDQTKKLIFQKAMQEADLTSTIAFAEAVYVKGDNVVEAAKLLVAKEQAAMAAQQQQQAGQQGPGGEVIPFPRRPGQAVAQAEALGKGAVPGGGAPSLAPTFTPPPAASVQVFPGRGP